MIRRVRIIFASLSALIVLAALLAAAPVPAAGAVPSTSREVTLAAVGDVMLGRGLAVRIASHGPEWPIARVKSLLRDADLAIANLECVIAGRRTGQPVRKAYTFRAPKAAADTLAAGGIDWISAANNHTFDYGADAFAEQQVLLAGKGISVAGAGLPEVAYSPVLSTVKGLRLAFLSYVMVDTERGGFQTRSWAAAAGRPGVAWADLATIRRAVSAARERADVVIVALHAGYELDHNPSPFQRRAARAAVDAGAALVLGHHAHLLQPVEQYHGGVIVYNLGNFIFDGFAQDPPALRSAVFQATIGPGGVKAWKMAPVKLVDGRPIPLEQ